MTISNTIRKNRFSAFNRQGERCYYCDGPMWLDDKEAFAARFSLSPAEASAFRCTAEHIKPKSEGGTNERANIVAACEFCNLIRHQFVPARPSVRHRQQVRRLVRHYGLVHRLST